MAVAQTEWLAPAKGGERGEHFERLGSARIRSTAGCHGNGERERGVDDDDGHSGSRELACDGEKRVEGRGRSAVVAWRSAKQNRQRCAATLGSDEVKNRGKTTRTATRV
ncbi:hypothetical protein E2562_038312 [Oryza meyeriana var. granulata]|uniref:Uncharacterized protein n=1 Tax=Oryza meyeriana var. granulata TaxID=110450 RepID=A0A6G1CM15_9ORYZ|nr:hypothetical protein E2562_038312 [Oryza meyeriana var. granulata]